MSLRRYRMAAALTATLSTADSMVFQRAGRIKRIDIISTANAVTDDAGIRIAVSRSAVSDIFTGASGTSVQTQTLAQAAWWNNFLTSGMAIGEINHQIDCDDPVAVGDQLFLGCIVNGTISALCDIIVVVDER